jgi:hypothetical protein
MISGAPFFLKTILLRQCRREAFLLSFMNTIVQGISSEGPYRECQKEEIGYVSTMLFISYNRMPVLVSLLHRLKRARY